MKEWWASIHWPAASDQNSSLDRSCARATVATSAIPMTMPAISMARCGTRRRGVGGSGGPPRAEAAPVVGTSKVSTTWALACTAPPRTGPPPASLRARYNAHPQGGVAGRLRSRRFAQPPRNSAPQRLSFWGRLLDQRVPGQPENALGDLVPGDLGRSPGDRHGPRGELGIPGQAVLAVEEGGRRAHQVRLQ